MVKPRLRFWLARVISFEGEWDEPGEWGTGDEKLVVEGTWYSVSNNVCYLFFPGD